MQLGYDVISIHHMLLTKLYSNKKTIFEPGYSIQFSTPMTVLDHKMTTTMLVTKTGTLFLEQLYKLFEIESSWLNFHLQSQ